MNKQQLIFDIMKSVVDTMYASSQLTLQQADTQPVTVENLLVVNAKIKHDLQEALVMMQTVERQLYT